MGSWGTLVGHYTLVGHSLVGRRRGAVLSTARALPARPPPKLTRQVPNMSFSYETSSKSHASSSKTSISRETSSKSQDSSKSEAGSLISTTKRHHLTIPCACREYSASPPPTRTQSTLPGTKRHYITTLCLHQHLDHTIHLE